MKEAFIIWITIQLMFIGIATCIITNEIEMNIYECPKNKMVNPLFGAIFPLIVFVNEPKEWDEYCENKLIN